MKLSRFAQKLQSQGIKIIFTPLEEYTSISSQFEDSETIDWIEEGLTHSLSYWFCASVKLEYNGIVTDTEYLGGCSYESFDQFTGINNDYFDQMLNTCLLDLKLKIQLIKESNINI